MKYQILVHDGCNGWKQAGEMEMDPPKSGSIKINDPDYDPPEREFIDRGNGVYEEAEEGLEMWVPIEP